MGVCIKSFNNFSDLRWKTTRRLLPPSLDQQKTREDLGIPQIPTLSQPLKDHIFLCYGCKVSCLLCSLSHFSKTAWETANLHFHNKQTVLRSRFKFPLVPAPYCGIQIYCCFSLGLFLTKNFNWLFLNFNQSFVLLECH